MPIQSHPFRFALAMAWRETRAATGKFVLVLISVALGAAALTAVTGFSESVLYTLEREARTLMAADISIRMPIEPYPADLEFLDRIGQTGVDSTRVTETVSMASSGDRPPILVSVKGIDQSKYPFYGQLQLQPPIRLDEHTVAVSDDLLLRLGLKLGDSIRIGEQEFKMGARIALEPDRMTAGLTLGPRVMFSREGLASTGIIVTGSRMTERVLLKLPPEHNLAGMRQSITDVFGRRARVTDYTETNPQLTRALNRSTRFLSLVSLIALIVAGLGVAATMQSHLRQKMNNIAFMKCIGGRSHHILRIYVMQAVLIGLIGSILGAVAGAFAQAGFSSLVANYFDIGITLIWPWMAMLKGVAVGLTTALLFALPALLSITEVKPAWILRQEVSDENRPPRDRRSVIAAVVVLTGLWLIAIWIGSSVRFASWFAGILLASLVVLGIVGALLLRLVRRFSSNSSMGKSAAVRHGVANLYRPGAHSTAILASISIGVMFTLSVYYLQHSLLEELRLTAPPDSPNLFLINITDRERDGIQQLLDNEPEITRQPLSPSVSAQIQTIDGIPLEQIPVEEGARRFLNTQFALTWSRDIPPSTVILEGSWWDGQRKEPVVSVQEFAAQALGLKVGSLIEWTAFEGKIRARVANIRRTDTVRIGSNNQFILSPGALDGFSAVYYGALRVRPSAVPALQSKIFSQFPTVTVINAADVLLIIQEVMDRVSIAIRFVAAFAIFGGLIVLASSVAGTRYRRMREVAILKTVGATQGTLVRMFCTEFAVIGSAAGLIGGTLGVIASAILIGQLLDTTYKFTWMPVLIAALVTAVLTVITGWLASYGVLSRKPLEILRRIES
jgi:putative ABC transport system permease protein